MKKYQRLAMLLLIGSLILSGCGSEEGGKTSKADAPEKEKPFEVKFDFNQYSDVPWKSEGGIWYFTEEDHPGNMGDLADWETDDLLLVQLGDEEYRGYELEPVSVQLLDAETAKIVLDLKEGDDAGSKNADPARTFIEVYRGVLKYKNFIVESKDGEKLRTN